MDESKEDMTPSPSVLTIYLPIPNNSAPLPLDTQYNKLTPCCTPTVSHTATRSQ